MARVCEKYSLPAHLGLKPYVDPNPPGSQSPQYFRNTRFFAAFADLCASLRGSTARTDPRSVFGESSAGCSAPSSIIFGFLCSSAYSHSCLRASLLNDRRHRQGSGDCGSPARALRSYHATCERALFAAGCRTAGPQLAAGLFKMKCCAFNMKEMADAGRSSRPRRRRAVSFVACAFRARRLALQGEAAEKASANSVKRVCSMPQMVVIGAAKLAGDGS